jgi:hypothetical protein
VGVVESVGARGAEEALELGDAVGAGDVVRAVELIEYMEPGEVGDAVVALVVISGAVEARNSNIAMASAAEIFEDNQCLRLP